MNAGQAGPILLLGKNGQIGWELQRSLAPLGPLVALDRHSGDLADLPAIAETVKTLRPAVIVNAAAYTAVDKAETESDLAHAVNARAPALLAQLAKESEAWLVHYSTDYVFDGTGREPWREDDTPKPLNVYGASKLAGEQAIAQSGCRHLIFRTSWVYAARGRNFAKTMLKLAAERERLAVVNDQIGAPTGAELLADVAAHAVRMALENPALAGLYHLAAAGETSWFDYADFVIRHARRLGHQQALSADGLGSLTTADYPTPARRPLNSRLNCTKLQQAFGLTLPAWQDGVARMVAEICGNGDSA